MILCEADLSDPGALAPERFDTSPGVGRYGGVGWFICSKPARWEEVMSQNAMAMDAQGRHRRIPGKAQASVVREVKCRYGRTAITLMPSGASAWGPRLAQQRSNQIDSRRRLFCTNLWDPDPS